MIVFFELKSESLEEKNKSRQENNGRTMATRISFKQAFSRLVPCPVQLQAFISPSATPPTNNSDNSSKSQTLVSLYQKIISPRSKMTFEFEVTQRTATMRISDQPSNPEIFTPPKPVTAPLSEFTVFPNLPLEIRLKIWKIASFEKRQVDVWSIAEVDYNPMMDSPSTPSTHFGYHYYSSTPPPAVLHVNQEARTECIKYYTLDFGVERTRDARPLVKVTFAPQIYVNWSADRVCFIIGTSSHEPDVHFSEDTCWTSYDWTAFLSFIEDFPWTRTADDSVLLCCPKFHEMVEEMRGGKRAVFEFEELEPVVSDGGECPVRHLLLDWLVEDVFQFAEDADTKIRTCEEGVERLRFGNMIVNGKKLLPCARH
jgi:hypothetical protein